MKTIETLWFVSSYGDYPVTCWDAATAPPRAIKEELEGGPYTKNRGKFYIGAIEVSDGTDLADFWRSLCKSFRGLEANTRQLEVTRNDDRSAGSSQRAESPPKTEAVKVPNRLRR